MVVASLVFDGLTSSQTDKQHKVSGRDYAYSIMFSNSLVQFLANFVIYSYEFTFQNDDTIVRVFKHYDIFWDVLMISVSGALGQIFIYLTISLFNSYYAAVITTTRKLFSVVLSNFSFNHHFSPL